MKVVLDAPIGGLGDGLLFSTLPELYHRRGFSVCVTQRTLDNCRNLQVRKLLYEDNPYIGGVYDPTRTQDEPLFIGIKHEREFFLKARYAESPIELIEELHGFPPTHKTPKIYYQPRYYRAFWDTLVVDSSSISQAFPGDTFDRFIAHIRDCKIDGMPALERIVKLVTPYGVDHGALPGVETYQPSDIYDYISVMASAQVFACTESGAQSLASAFRRNPTYVLCTTQHYNARLYVYPNVRYTVTGKLTDDYLWNDLTAQDVDPERFPW